MCNIFGLHEVGDDYRKMLSADIGYYVAMSTLVFKWMVWNFSDRRNTVILAININLAILRVTISFNQVLTNRNFKFRIFGQGYPYGITDSIFEQGANTDCRFNSSVFSIACFCNANM